MPERNWTLTDAPDLGGRVAVVTGASGGLGYETALGLATRGATVILAGRNEAKGGEALARILRANAKALLRFERLDLADLRSVEAFAARLGSDAAVDILVNNAGVMALATRRTTADGFEMQFGTNFLGHFALTARLMPALLRARGEARVVSLASLAHRQGRIALDDLQAEHGYDPWTAYRQSKLAMLMFARELQRRAGINGWPIRSVAAHPGWAATRIIDNGPGREGRSLKTLAMNLVFRLRGQSASAGALPVLFAATSPEAQPGGYYGPAGRGEVTGPVGPSGVMPQAADEETARRLWDAAARLTDIGFPSDQAS